MSEAGNGSSIASNRSRFVGEKCGREAGEGQTRAAIAVVIAGLDPAIHPVREKLLRKRWTRGSSPRVTEELRRGILPLTRRSLRSRHPLPASRGEGSQRDA